MSKIKWKTNTWNGPNTVHNVTAKIGCLVLKCTPNSPTRPNNTVWLGSVELGDDNQYGTVSSHRWVYEESRSLAKCQDCVIRLAKELLADYNAVIKKTMKHFGMEGDT